MLRAAAPAAEIEAAAAPAFAAIESFRLDEDILTSQLRAYVAEAQIRAGRPDRTADVIAPLIEGPTTRDYWPVIMMAAELAVVQGDLVTARRTHARLQRMEIGSLAFRVEVGIRLAELELWDGHPDAALSPTMKLLGASASERAPGSQGAPLVLAARAAADLVERGEAPSEATRWNRDGLKNCIPRC